MVLRCVSCQYVIFSVISIIKPCSYFKNWVLILFNITVEHHHADKLYINGQLSPVISLFFTHSLYLCINCTKFSVFVSFYHCHYFILKVISGSTLYSSGWHSLWMHSFFCKGRKNGKKAWLTRITQSNSLFWLCSGKYHAQYFPASILSPNTRWEIYLFCWPEVPVRLSFRKWIESI